VTNEERIAQIAEHNQSLADKGTLLLTVKLSTKEQAAEIMDWMYSSKEKPMKSELVEIAWNKRAVTEQEYELVCKARELNSN